MCFCPNFKFILFFNMVVWCWRDHCQVQGNLLVKELEYLVKLYFANDAAIVAPTKEYIIKGCGELDGWCRLVD